MVEIILGIGSFELSLGEAATFDDISGFLPKERVEGLAEALSDKADKVDVYTKGEVDTRLDSKANASEVYTKAETNTLLDNKANVSDLASKQNTLTAGDNITIVDDVISASGSVDDVQINGTSIVVDKVANIPYASEGVYGVTTVTGEKVEQIKIDLSELTDRVDTIEREVKDLIKENFDGTKIRYNRLMKEWFIDNGALTATPEELTSLCDEWYSFTRTGWDGYTTFYQPNVSSVSTGTKGGDNADMICIPSTDAVKGQDDYEGLPQFAIKDCNFVVSDNGDILITAIDGITPNFERYNPNVYVGVLQMSMYHYWYEDNETYTHGICDGLKSDYEFIKPYPEAIKVDGSVRAWVCHAKYMASVVDGKFTCCAGLIPKRLMSHNQSIIHKNNNGAQYSAGTMTDWSFLVLMTFIKYGSMTLDGLIQGCCNYNFQYNCVVAESGVKRVILTVANGNNVEVGSSILIGTGTSGEDRGNVVSYNLSGEDGVIVTDKETVEIDGTAYIAVYFDIENAINTDTSVFISSWHWRSGTNDIILGNDGSIRNASNGKFPSKLQGIEFAVGGYEVTSDSIMWLDGVNYQPYLVRDSKKQTSNATPNTAGYVASGLLSSQPETASLLYISKLTFNGEIFFQGETENGSSSKYTKDAFYKNNTAAKLTGREVLLFGALGYGVGRAGMSCLVGNYGLSDRNWNILARISCNGNRGEFA